MISKNYHGHRSARLSRTRDNPPRRQNAAATHATPPRRHERRPLYSRPARRPRWPPCVIARSLITLLTLWLFGTQLQPNNHNDNRVISNGGGAAPAALALWRAGALAALLE